MPPVVVANDESPERIWFPTIGRRANALLIDLVLWAAIFFLGGWALSSVDLPPAVRIGTPLVLLFVLEPLLVTMRGITVGHHLMGLRIQKSATGERLNIVEATLRFFVKVFFGWVSLVSVLISNRHQALHDLMVGSVVVLTNPSRVSSTDRLVERDGEEEEGFVYPSRTRRVLMIILYAFLLNFFIGFIGFFLIGFLTRGFGELTWITITINIVSSLAWLAAFLYMAPKMWRGEFLGCRKKSIDLETAT